MFYSSVCCVFFGHLPSLILSQWLATASSKTDRICSEKIHNIFEV